MRWITGERGGIQFFFAKVASNSSRNLFLIDGYALSNVYFVSHIRLKFMGPRYIIHVLGAVISFCLNDIYSLMAIVNVVLTLLLDSNVNFDLMLHPSAILTLE